MADSKYADLPGIARDQPDVYETSDLPESDQNTNFYEEESDSIERLHISANEAFSKFKGKSISSTGVDFSDRLSKSRRTGYDARSGVWELVGTGEKETPLQKYQRLQCEIKELLEEIAQCKDTIVSEKTKDQESSVMLASQVEQAQRQLADMRLEETLGCELVTNLADPHGLQLKPDHARLSQTARITELEHRLHRLESAVGADPDKLKRLSLDTQHKSLLELAQFLSAKVALLDSTQLDQIEGRLVTLALKMDSVAEKSGTQDPEHNQKVLELYDMVKKVESLSHVLPKVLQRLTALESLHQQAANVSKSLAQLEALQQQITSGLQSNESLLKKVQTEMSQNLDAVKKNMSSLDARVSTLTK